MSKLADAVKRARGEIAQKLHPRTKPPEEQVLGAEAIPNGCAFDAQRNTPIKEPDGKAG